MTFSASCDWTLVRSLVLTIVACPLCWGCERGLKASPRAALFLALLVLPLLFPELLMSYLVAPFVVGRPWRAEWACDAILLLRCVPVGVLTLWVSPPSSLSRSALYLRWMACRGWHDGCELMRCYWLGPVRRLLPALGLMFLVTFQEFEAAALLGAVSWTDRLFTEHALGLSLVESTRFLVRPLLIQGAVLAVVGWGLFRREADSAMDHEIDVVTPIVSRGACAFAGLWCFIGVILPLLLLSRELMTGWAWLIRQPQAVEHLFAEIGTAGLVGLVAGLLAWNAARFLCAETRQRSSFSTASGEKVADRPDEGVVLRRRTITHPLTLTISPAAGEREQASRWLLAIACLPGLCGALTVSLTVLQLSTWSMMRSLSSTPIWWVLASAIWLFPRAVLLQLWWRRSAEPASLHLVALLRESPHAGQRRLAWRRWWAWRVEPQVAAVGVLCYWAYLDLTSADLLAPPGMASVVKRLYTFMHYGHSAAMTMEAMVAMFVPAIAWGTLLVTARLGRWGGRG